MYILNSFLAEREGFEPSVRYQRTHAFQACALSRSAISPYLPFRKSFYFIYSDDVNKIYIHKHNVKQVLNNQAPCCLNKALYQVGTFLTGYFFYP